MLCIAYLFAGIGYYMTCKDRIKDLLLKSWEKQLVIFAIVIGVGLWLPILGFAVTMTEIELYIKRKCRYNY
jgi:hypothetical protein